MAESRWKGFESVEALDRAVRGTLTMVADDAGLIVAVVSPFALWAPAVAQAAKVLGVEQGDWVRR